ncbi:hypothetical protein E3P99_00759 [Wallemia hederae]|uniref:Probable beta-glucosidase G n=1 Tax=Wallemia hederae TaxID=1540922 RepID=A0A4T0FU67_9BASI|nr:hypothetical protein E3P99_00759 [Wallemia hederae]
MKLTAILAISIALALTQARALDARQADAVDATETSNTSRYDAFHQPNDFERFPAPASTGGKAWQEAFSKAKDMVAQMTLEEKSGILLSHDGRCVGNTHGVDRLGIPDLCLMDGPTGVRPGSGISSFPAGQAAAATWDRDLIYQRSKAMGQEFFDKGVHIALAPVSAGPLGRSPLGGRNWEGSYPDAYANGVYSYESVRGMQDSHVAATIKHFIGYEQETSRNPYTVSSDGGQEPISSNVDDKTMHEVYLAPFAQAIRGGSAHVMCSYNKINGTNACGNAQALNGLLKGEINHQGAVISDWGGIHSSLDVLATEMSAPGTGFAGLFGDYYSDMPQLVNNGTVSEDRIDDACIRILTPYYWLGQDEEHVPPEVVFNANNYYEAEDTYKNVRKPDTAQLIHQIALESAVLLKNTGGLPLNNPERLAVVGALGDTANSECGATGTGCDYNTSLLTMGGGSGWSDAPYIVTPLDALKTRARDANFELSHALTYDEEVINDIAGRADSTLVWLNDWAEESADREDLTIGEEQSMMLEAAVHASSNVIIVMNSPVVDIEQYAEHPNVTAIVQAHYTGEAADAVVSALFGDENFSGKLPYTWGKRLEDWPNNTIVTTDDNNPQAYFDEGVFVDYKWFDKHEIEPRYEFGFGLSYTTFECSDIKIADNYKKDDMAIQDTAEPFEGFDGSNSLYDVIKTVTAIVTNTGDRKGSEVAQLYVTLPGEDMPVRELRGFEKIRDLDAGESREVSFDVTLKDLSTWDVQRQMWVVPQGDFVFHVGNSSRNLPLNATSSF